MSRVPPPGKVSVLFQFRGNCGGVSIERLFHDICDSLPADIAWRSWRAPYCGANPKAILLNMIAAWRNRGDSVTHVTGHEHYLVVLLSRKRSVLTIHDTVGVIHLSGWRRRVYIWLQLKLPVRRAAVTTAISEKTAKEVSDLTGAPLEKIRVIPNCISSDYSYTPAEFRRSQIRLLLVGAGWNKNVARVARAVMNLDVDLTIIGKTLRDDDRAALEKSEVAYRLTGRLSDEEVLEAYRSTDIVVFASEYEGFGLPILEAQGVGRALVTSSIEPMVSVAGPGACCVDPLDIDAIRAAIVRLIEDADFREACVAAGLENVNQYRPEAISERYAEIYRSLAPDG